MSRKGSFEFANDQILYLVFGVISALIIASLLLPRILQIGDMSNCTGPTKFLFSMLADTFGNIVC